METVAARTGAAGSVASYSTIPLAPLELSASTTVLPTAPMLPKYPRLSVVERRTGFAGSLMS